MNFRLVLWGRALASRMAKHPALRRRRDHSTRGQEKNNVTDFVAMAEVNRDTGADGFNADTMTHVPQVTICK